MKDQTNYWLKQTILWQRVVLVFFGLIWLLSCLGAIAPIFYSYGGSDVGELLFGMLIGGGSFGWTGYIVYQLYKNIESTKGFMGSHQSIHWQEALQYQKNFWKHLCLILLIGVALSVLGGAFLLLLFVGAN
ncbi:MAG: hypothetical protein ACRBFS_12600 [Aureispira sp.]